MITLSTITLHISRKSFENSSFYSRAKLGETTPVLFSQVFSARAFSKHVTRGGNEGSYAISILPLSFFPT